MSTPVNVKDFPYILWKSDDGRCWIKVKATDEITEVSKAVMRELRRQEKETWRETEELNENPTPLEELTYNINHPLSLDEQARDLERDEAPLWTVDTVDIERIVVSAGIEELLLEKLTDRQRDCYQCCVVLGESRINYAKRNGISARRVTEIFGQIQRKIKKLL